MVPRGDPAPVGLRLHGATLDAVIVGRVMGSTGEPVEGAQVMAFAFAPELTDAAGRFRLAVPSASGGASIHVRAPGFAIAQVAVRGLSAGHEVVRDVHLSRGVAMQGRVVDEEGLPVAGADVMSFLTAWAGSVRTDRRGQFSVDYLDPRQEQHSLIVRKAGFREAKLTEAAPVTGLELVLERGVVLQGSVMGMDGEPIAGAAVSLGAASDFSRIEVVSGDDGRWSMAGLAPGVHKVDVRRAGFQAARLVARVPGDGQIAIRLRRQR